MSDREGKDRRIGIITSMGIHLGVLALLFFVVAWKAPNPPLPEFGIELNFGTEGQGSGEVQPQTPVGDQVKENETPDQQTSEQQTEEVKTDAREEKDAVQEEKSEKIDSKVESDVAVKEEKKQSEVVKDKPKDPNPEKKVLAEFKKDEKKEVNPSDKTKQGEEGNQGDDKDKTGDKGNPEGKLDAKALYGVQGGGGGGDGMNLSMSGWAWAEKPKIPELPDNENGKVVFEIVCDADGEILRITTVERSLSPKAEDLLKKEIMRNSLVRTSTSGKAPEQSKGTIVFILKTK